MRKIITGLTIFFLFSSGNALFAQKTVVNEKPQNTYSRALNLYSEQNFGAAEKLFAQYKSEVNNPNDALYENASYYQTMCAVQTYSDEALDKVRNFAASYPESAWLPSINFELGNLYYKQRKYGDALETYKNLSPRQLSRVQRIEYYYKVGYCQLEADQLDAAYNSFAKVKGTRSTYAQPAFYYSAHIQYEKGKYQEALKDFKEIENNRKYSRYVPQYLVHIYYETGNYETAIEEGKKFIESADYKSKPEIARLIANSYFSLNQFEDALAYYDIYEKTAHQKISADEQYRIGFCKFMAKEYKSAIYNFQEASREDDAFTQNAWYHLGFCYLNTGEQQFAQNAFLKAYKEGNDNSVSTDALFNYIKITIERGSDPYNDPVAIMEDFIAKNPNLPRINEAYDLLAQLYVTSNNYRGALLSIEKTRNPNYKLKEIYQQIAFAQGVDYYNRGAYTDAIGFFEKSLKYTPDKKLEAKTIYWIGDSFYHLKQFRDASGMYAKFLSSSEARQSGLYAMGLYNYAYTAFNLKHYSTAIEYFNKFLDQSGNASNMVSDARLRLADSYYITKNYAQASAWYDKVIAAGIEGTDYALYQKAFCYGAEDSFGKKISTLKTLISRYPNSQFYDDALFEIASSSLILSDQRSAIIYFDKLVKEKPGSSLAKKALVKMGFVYYNNKQYDRAISTLKEVVNKYPASLEAKEALNALQNVYMDIGKVDEYFAYAKSLDFIQVATSEEDSLTFTTGENYYMADDCSNAVNALKNYLVKFPNGGFVLKSYHYLSSCFEKQKMNDQALEYYKKIIEFPDNQYTDEALIKAGRIEYDKKNYFDAFSDYSKLARITENQGMRVEGNDGAMRSAYMMGKFKEASDYAHALLKTEKVSEEQVVFAHYIIAKSALEMHDIATAEQEFGITDQLTSGELGAESKYQLAEIMFQRHDLDKAEDLIYQIPEQYADFDYWIAKGFVLLADIYMERDNAFQAEQTLQSIIDNYPRDDLKNVAREKLETIKKQEENK